MWIRDQFLQIPFVNPSVRFAKTLWLFTKSDVATFVLPNTVFGVFGALSGLLTTAQTVNTYQVFERLPHVVAFNWLNLLIFDVANQRLPAAIAEDTVNKPWRPMPTKRVTQAEAETLLLRTVPLVLLVCLSLGVGFESAILVALTWMYNDLGGGDRSFWIRNEIIAAAFAVYNAGSLKLAIGAESRISGNGLVWIGIISAVIFTTMHTQDLKDQAGDEQRRRRTVPLVLGDGVARWTIVIALTVWAIFCPYFWRTSGSGYLMSGGLATVVATRMLRWRNAKADTETWRLWAWWTAILYSLPFLKSLG